MIILEKTNKKIGVGSLSLLLSVMGILFCIPNIRNVIHYTMIYSLIFFISSLIVSHKFKENLGAYLGEKVSLIMLLLVVPVMLF